MEPLLDDVVVRVYGFILGAGSVATGCLLWKTSSWIASQITTINSLPEVDLEISQSLISEVVTKSNYCKDFAIFCIIGGAFELVAVLLPPLVRIWKGRRGLSRRH